MSITRSSSPSRASSPLPASLNICRGTALRIVGGGILGGGSGARAAPTPAPEPRLGKVSGPPTGQSGGPTAICSRGGRNTGRGCQEGMGPPGGWHCPLRQFWGMGRGKGSFKGYWTQPGQPCWNQGPTLPAATSESQTSKCLRVRGSSDGGSDEGGWGLQETRRERLGPASPGRHLGSPCEGTAVRASLDLPACL